MIGFQQSFIKYIWSRKLLKPSSINKSTIKPLLNRLISKLLIKPSEISSFLSNFHQSTCLNKIIKTNHLRQSHSTTTNFVKLIANSIKVPNTAPWQILWWLKRLQIKPKRIPTTLRCKSIHKSNMSFIFHIRTLYNIVNKMLRWKTNW